MVNDKQKKSVKKLKKLIAEVLRVKEKEINDDLSITKTEVWDSLKHMELIVVIEENFAIQLTADEIIAMVNMKEIKRVLKKKGVNI